MELAGEIRDEFLTCNICLEAYTRPKQLPCLHTFCLKCLSHYIAQTVGHSGMLSVACPLCRRACVPPDPDPRRVAQWADQFPDNFFVASLQAAVESRGERGGGGGGGGGEERGSSRNEGPDTAQAGQESPRYFLGEATSCSKHLTQRRTCYCLTASAGVCDQCLRDEVHSSCSDHQHLDYDQARLKAAKLLTDYQERMKQVKSDIKDIRRSFGRKPHLLQTKKEEVEIAIRDHFSEQRSKCAKLLLTKEREMIETLTKLVDDDERKSQDSWKECDDIVTSVDNTMTLFETLTRGGPFNAMRVLATVEGQIAKFTRLTAKMDRESKADALRFQPATENLAERLSDWDFGEVVAEFDQGGMSVQDSNTDDAAERNEATQSLQSRLSEIELRDTNAPPHAPTITVTEGPNSLVNPEEPRTSTITEGSRTPTPPPTYTEGSRTPTSPPTYTEGSRTPTSPPTYTEGSRTPTPPPTYTEVESHPHSYSPTPTAPPLDEYSPPPYAGSIDFSRGSGDFSCPTRDAPPSPSLSPNPAQPQLNASFESNQSLSARIAASPTLMAAYQKSMRKEISCRPVMVFSGNLPNESRRGGLCGAANLNEVNRAAFVDRHNRSVKIVDLDQAQVVGFLSLGNMEPWDVTFIGKTEELVVTCPSSRYLLFIPTSSKRLEIVRHSVTSIGYSCIAYIKDQEFAGAVCPPFGTGQVHVINMAGHVLREILRGQCSYPRTIFCNSEGTLLVLSDWTSNVVFLASPEGEVVSVYREAPGPKGVAVSELTNALHVLDGKWAKLHLLDTDGNCLGSGKIEGCRDPRMVVVVTTYSSYFSDTELTVVADGNNALHVMSVSTDSWPYSSDDYQYYTGSAV